MSVVHDRVHGPYTVYDLDSLPDEGKGFELAEGWLTPLSPSPRHDMAADMLRDILRDAARAAQAGMYVQAPMDISTPAGVRRPDVAMVGRDAARAVHEANARTYYGRDVILVAEVISNRSGSERVDRVDKLTDYAHAGIEWYWIVDLEPRPRIQVHTLDGAGYRLAETVGSGERLRVDKPFPVAFDPAVLLEFPSE